MYIDYFDIKLGDKFSFILHGQGVQWWVIRKCISRPDKYSYGSEIIWTIDGNLTNQKWININHERTLYVYCS